MPGGVNHFSPWLGAFETLRVIDGQPLFAAQHHAELRRALAALGLRNDADFEDAAASLPKKSGRWRWIVRTDEPQVLFTEEEPLPDTPMAVGISPVRVGSANWDARFKTLSYLSHYQAAVAATTPEVVLLNELGHVASAARGNIFWRRGGKLFTPAHEAGCRCGVVRSLVMKWHAVEAGHFPAKDLLAADEIFLTNSMRGIVSVRQIGERKLDTPVIAVRLRAAYGDAVAEQLKR